MDQNEKYSTFNREGLMRNWLLILGGRGLQLEGGGSNNELTN